MTLSMPWLTLLWGSFLAVVFLLALRGRWRYLGRGLALTVMLLVSIPCMPAVSLEKQGYRPATQTVYRFDEHRYLTLTGYGCEGAMNYVDKKRGIDTPMIEQFARVFLPKIIHADNDGDYIFIPYYEPSAFRVSKDHGRTFQDARWVGPAYRAARIESITVVNRQAFVRFKDGRLFMTSKPIGQYWGMGVVDPINELPNLVHSERPEYQGLPTEVPEVKNYQGWDEMRCDPDLQGEPIQSEVPLWNRVQQEITSLLGKTIAYPVVWIHERLG